LVNLVPIEQLMTYDSFVQSLFQDMNEWI
jgi:hypothetical protein